jgi:hypothetical protein
MWKALERIRIRLVVGLWICFTSVALFVGLSYKYFLELEDRLFALNVADEIVNLTLEARHYEKNYFLYRQEADFLEALRYLGQLEKAVLTYWSSIQGSMGIATWSQWKDFTWLYRRALSVAHDLGLQQESSGAKAEFLKEQIATIRSVGHDLVGLAEGLSRTERETTMNILGRYRVLFGIFFISTLSLGDLTVYLWRGIRRWARAQAWVSRWSTG